jgi:membrane protease YdiL (CAAX protease family)
MDETALAEKLRARPDLQAAANLELLAIALLCVGGAWVVWRFVARRGWRDLRGLEPVPRTGIADALAGALILLVAWVSVGAFLRLRSGAAAPPAAPPPFEEVVANVGAIAGIAALSLALFAWREGGVAAIGLPGRAPGSATRAGLTAFLGAFPLYFAAEYASRAAFAAFGAQPKLNPAAVLIAGEDSLLRVAALSATAAFIVPISEEVLFRGFIFGAIRRRSGPIAAALASAVLFALVHPPLDWLPILILALALAGVYEKTGSLLAPMAAHAATNVVGVALLLLNRAFARA